jgi:hypothetical protein
MLSRLGSLVLVMLVCAAACAQAQAQMVAASGDSNVEGRLSRLEAQVGELNSRMVRVERIVAHLAEASANLYETVAARGPSDSDYRLVSLTADRQVNPPSISPQAGVLSQSETGRVEFRAYGNGSVRLALAGGGMIAVGSEPGGAIAKASLARDDFGGSPAPVSYYRKTNYSRPAFAAN